MPVASVADADQQNSFSAAAADASGDCDS